MQGCIARRRRSLFGAALGGALVLGVAGPVRAVDPGTVISGVQLASEILKGINSALTMDARVDAVSQSAGPDNDDLGVIADSDTANSFIETDLDAWTTRAGGTKLGPNGGQDHVGFARMHVSSPATSTRWTVVKNDRYAFAAPKKDTTPVEGSDNTTTVASVATFALNGSLVAGFTVQATGSSLGITAAAPRLALPAGTEDITVSQAGSLSWSLNAFKVEDQGDGTVKVTAPVSSALLFHNHMQLSSSTNFRTPATIAPIGDPQGDALAQSIANTINSNTNTTLGTTSFGSSDKADLTLSGAKVNFAPGVISSSGKSLRQILEEYLLSNAVTFVAPDNAQAGYDAQLTKRALIGGSHTFETGSIFETEGGFGTPDFASGEETFDFSNLVGFYIESEGSLLDAVNRAANTPGSPISNMLLDRPAGSLFNVTLNFNSSDLVSSSASTNVVPLPPGVWSGLIVLVGIGLAKRFRREKALE